MHRKLSIRVIETAILSDRLGRESIEGTRHKYRPLSPVNVFCTIN